MSKTEETKVPAKPMQKALVEINKLKPLQIPEDPRTHKKFVTLYKQIHGSDRGELIYQSEKFHFLKLLREKPELQKCSPISLMGAFFDIAVQGLSVDPTKKLAYVVPIKGVACLWISGYGELQLRMDYKQVKYVDRPVVVYDCDIYKVGTDKTGKKTIEYTKVTPRPKDADVVASFIRITRNDGSIELIDFDADDFARWRSASLQPNSLGWTKHYSSMISTKTIKHAFNTYPKLNLKGQFTKLESTVDETEDVDYGIVDEETGEVTEVKNTKAEPEVFGDKPKEETEKTVTAASEEEGEDGQEIF